MLKASQVSWLFALSVFFIVLADWLFWDWPVGWTLGAYGILLVSTLFLWEKRKPHGKIEWLVTLTVVIFCLQYFIEPGGLNITLGVLGLMTLSLILHEGWLSNGLAWLQRWATFAVIGWFTPFFDTFAYYRHRLTEKREDHSSSPWLHKWTIPILMSIIFLLLFATANPVISKWLKDALLKIQQITENLYVYYPSGSRVITWVLIGTGVWALLRFHSNLREPEWGKKLTGDATDHMLIPPSVITRCLLLFNGLFALQIVLDVCYLWGGLDLPDGMTYAEYAHRGAYPLLAAGILAAVFVFAAFRGSTSDKRMRPARYLVYLWLLQNTLLLSSAAWRLWLYIGAYSLSRWRVAAIIWMFLVLCGVIWIIVRIATRRSNLWLVNVNAVTLFVVLFICSFCNFDAWIARFNTSHCYEVHGGGEPLDLEYLESLGPDTLPALISFAEKVENRKRKQHARHVINRLHDQLREKLSNWRGWTWQRHQLMQLDYPPPVR